MLIISALGHDDLYELCYPTSWPKPTYTFSKNTLTREGIELGRQLFYDPIISADSTISCASCHLQYTAFAHVDHAISHGINDRIGKRNAPVLINLAWHSHFMWDGAIHHLDQQSLAPISHPDEMGSNLADVVKKINQEQSYRQRFYQAWHDSTATGEHLLKSISQFMVTLISQNTLYDSVMNGTAKFTDQQQRGHLLFKKYCNSCHTEPLFTNGQFANNGLPPDPFLNDSGRAAITNYTGDLYAFKIPTLRNIEYSFPYMHDGRFQTLQQVLNHYSANKHNSTTLSNQLKEPFLFTSNERIDLIAFLLTLTDRHFLFNPAYSYPKKN